MSAPRRTFRSSWIAGTLLATLVLYPLSFGPALYVAVKADPFLSQANQHRVEECYTVLYFPILMVELHCPDWMSQPVKAYHHWWIDFARGR